MKIAVVGAGAMGRRHAELVAAEPATTLSAIVDPRPAAQELASRLGARWFAALPDLLAAERPDGVIIATPNRLHLQNGLEAVAAGIPAMVEKPIAHDVAAATELAATAERAGVSLLVGHHRRYNPLVAAAKEIVESGRLGRIVAVHGHFWVLKPDSYFETDWRRETGAGPVLLNLIHDIDLMRHLCGEVASVQAVLSNAVRGNAVEETAAVLLRFADGAVGTFGVSDCVASPWSWELTSGESAAFPRQAESCYQIGGTLGSLALPHLDLWFYRDRRGWLEPLTRERATFTPADPLERQLRHFADVVAGRAAPRVSAREGLRTLAVVEAIHHSARAGRPVEIAL